MEAGESLDGPITKMVQAVSRAAPALTEWIGKDRRTVQADALAIAALFSPIGSLPKNAAVGICKGKAAFIKAVGNLHEATVMISSAVL